MADTGDMTQLLALILSNAAANAQKQNNTNDTNAISLAGDALNRDKFGVSAPGSRLASSTKASILSNFTPRHTTWAGPGSGLKGQVPTITGGIDQSLANLDPSTKALAQLVMKDQLAGQQVGGITGGKQDYKLPAIGQTSGADKALGAGATAASALAGLAGNKGSGSGGNIPVDDIINWFKNRGNNTIPTPDTGYGVLDPGAMEGLGPGMGPRLPVGPTDPMAGTDPGQQGTAVPPDQSGLSQELLNSLLSGGQGSSAYEGGDEWDYGPDPSTSEGGGS